MSKYLTKLVSKEIVAEDTMAFHFERPLGFNWEAGQSLDITLIKPAETDGEGSTRTFSIVSAPYEQDVTITTRMRDTAFKRVLRKMEPGTEVKMAEPSGSFTLHEKESRPAVMLVGGIGITPFMSMIKDATKNNLPIKIFLFYSNRRPEDSVFLDQLKDLQNQNPNFKFIPTMTEMNKSAQSWSGETGYINREMIEKHVPDRTDAVYYSAGPQAMITAMRKVLRDMGVSKDDIKTEEFTGY
jgi:ferredoxin-NADP reductase